MGSFVFFSTRKIDQVGLSDAQRVCCEAKGEEKNANRTVWFANSLLLNQQITGVNIPCIMLDCTKDQLCPFSNGLQSAVLVNPFVRSSCTTWECMVLRMLNFDRAARAVRCYLLCCDESRIRFLVGSLSFSSLCFFGQVEKVVGQGFGCSQGLY